MRARYLGGNRLTLLDSGREYFPALLAALAAAENEILLETYIFADDRIGQAVATALVAAAARGVSVRVIVDGFGARNFAADFQPQLQAAGVQAMIYRPELARFSLKRHRLRRLHRKLVAVDGRIGFVGGINIVDDDNAPPGLRPRFDFAVRVEGPLLQPLHAAMLRLWEIVTWVGLRRRYRIRQPSLPTAEVAGGQTAAFLVRDNLRHRLDIAHAYMGAIALARDEVLIGNAYFLPGLRFRRALRRAARRGVRVCILVQGVSDHPLLQYATQALYGALLREGIRIFEYRKSFLHAKVAVVDGRWATVGSSNIDPFSLLLAREANIAVRDRDFAAQLHRRLETAMATGAVELRSEDLARMPWWSRLLRWSCYTLVRLAVGLSGYGAGLWQAAPEDDDGS